MKYEKGLQLYQTTTMIKQPQCKQVILGFLLLNSSSSFLSLYIIYFQIKVKNNLKIDLALVMNPSEHSGAVGVCVSMCLGLFGLGLLSAVLSAPLAALLL